MVKKIRVLFVCLGNICRSPTAEAVFRALVERSGLQDIIEIESAGTAAYHAGEGPDHRATRAAGVRGYDMSALRARQVDEADFLRFDYILAMDSANHRELISLCPAESRHKVGFFLDYGENDPGSDVPDPYYGGEDGFDHVLDLVEDAARGLLEDLRCKTDQ